MEWKRGKGREREMEGKRRRKGVCEDKEIVVREGKVKKEDGKRERERERESYISRH